MKPPRKQNKSLIPEGKAAPALLSGEKGLERLGLIPNSCWDEGGQMAQLWLEWDGQRGIQEDLGSFPWKHELGEAVEGIWEVLGSTFH